MEHIGSTAIPGLGAKPIIDIMVGVSAATPFSDCRVPLEGLEYENRGHTVPGTPLYRKEDPRRFNLHLTRLDGSFWLDHLLFRDYLGTHADAAKRYEGLKVSLLADFAANPLAYNFGKSAFIKGILMDARAERDRSY